MFRANINVMTFSLKNICPFLYLKVMPLIENKRVDFVSGYCYCWIIFISDHFLACTGHWSQGTTWTRGLSPVMCHKIPDAMPAIYKS